MTTTKATTQIKTIENVISSNKCYLKNKYSVSIKITYYYYYYYYYY